MKEETEKPTFGGTLNATTAGAEEDRAEQEEREKVSNNVALTHGDDTSEDSTPSVDDARKAVEDAAVSQPFNPANQPIQAINTQPLPTVQPSDTPDPTAQQVQAQPNSNAVPAVDDEANQSPVDAFMQPHAPAQSQSPAPTNQAPVNQGFATASDPGLPPLPPLPNSADQNTAQSSAFPPLPPLPGQPNNQADQMQPQINPGFMQSMPQSQNPWTSAGQDMAAKQADKDAARQEKMDTMNQQYDTAVDRNRELQGLPPLNNPNGSGLPPVPPQK